MWAKDYAQTLISEVLRQVPMSLPDDEPLDIEYANDPPAKRCHRWVASGVLPWMLPNGVTFSMAYPRPHIQDNNDRITQVEKDAQEMAAKYPHMDVEQWKTLLLGRCDSEKDSTG
ncbi:hypothetical protein [Nostoc sp. KVJ20]|uniref:hypothetical protein n=1 Tax=Nostoc sp. KVJ20 TaxID=457944 RepID=UPI00083DD15D|nr:hypothetical protein [Nostoc sp. KVJ20]